MLRFKSGFDRENNSVNISNIKKNLFILLTFDYSCYVFSLTHNILN